MYSVFLLSLGTLYFYHQFLFFLVAASFNFLERLELHVAAAGGYLFVAELVPPRFFQSLEAVKVPLVLSDPP